MDDQRLAQIKALPADQQSAAFLESIAEDASTMRKWVQFFGIISLMSFAFSLIAALTRG